jgi:lipopolysaccharide export system protein LptA
MTRSNLYSRPVAAAVVLAAAVALQVPFARAEKADRDKPINYQADSGDVNYQTKIGTLLGNVILTQGTLTIHADKIVFHQNPDNSVSATAYGNPITFREKRDNVDEYYEGFAQRAEYDGQKRFLELFDRALLRKGTDEIRSNYISYNAETEFFKAEGRPDTRPAAAGESQLGARVRGVFQPQPKDANKDDKTGKDSKAPVTPPTPNPPAPLKTDDALRQGPTK